MEDLVKKYYGDKSIAIVLNGSDFVEDMDEYGQDGDGYYKVCNSQLKFKDILLLPGCEEEFDDPDYYLDCWSDASQFNCPKYIVTRKIIFTENDVDEFNEWADTDFETFEECYDYMCEDFSANVIEDPIL